MSITALRSWPVLKFLEPSFVSKIRMVFVFGSLSDEVLIITNDSKVYGFGTNTAGCLGIGTTNSTVIPQEVKELSGKSIKKFACGAGPHVLALTTDGVVYAWGSNSKKELGTDTVASSCIPVCTAGLIANRNIVDIACGFNQSFVLADNGLVFAAGLSYSVSSSYGYNKTEYKTWQQISIPESEKVVSIASGHGFTRFLTACHTVYACTSDGAVSTLLISDIQKVVCGLSHTLALTQSGDIFAWGGNLNGQLGLGDLSNRDQPQKVSFPGSNKIVDIAAIHCNDVSIAIDNEDRVFIWGLCRGQAILKPMECFASNVHDAMAFFGTPGVMPTPLYIHETEHTVECGILESLKLSFDDHETSDLVMIVEGKEIHVHKAILKMRSPYFQKMFSEPWEENKVTRIEEALHSYDIYKAFLKYLYTDKIDIDDVMNVYNLFEIADQHFLPVLKERCTMLIKRTMNITDVGYLYKIVAEKHFEELQTICIDFMLHNMTDVVRSSGFAELPDALVKTFLLKAAESGAFKT